MNRTLTIKINAEDFVTIHHELGHNFYQRAYEKQPYFFRGSANDGFHEAIGDFVGLSALTPTYLQQIGLIDQAPGADEDKDNEQFVGRSGRLLRGERAGDLRQDKATNVFRPDAGERGRE